MTTKKKRMTMLDGLSAAGHTPPAPGSSMMSTNRALRSARDAVDSHQVWDLDPDTIEDDRIADRLDVGDRSGQCRGSALWVPVHLGDRHQDQVVGPDAGRVAQLLLGLDRTEG